MESQPLNERTTVTTGEQLVTEAPGTYVVFKRLDGDQAPKRVYPPFPHTFADLEQAVECQRQFRESMPAGSGGSYEVYVRTDDDGWELI